MAKLVLGIFDDYAAAGQAVDELKDAGFAPGNISLLGKDTEELRPLLRKISSNKPDRLMTDLGVAGAIGGLLVGLSSIAVPGAGSILVAGPLVAAISGAAAGSAIGVVTGALVHFDVPETEAHSYEAHLTEGKVLVAVHTDAATERFKAEEALDRAGAVEIDTKAA
jgi:outer membrane lipoprotein SlyB